MADDRHDDATSTTGAVGVAELYRRLAVVPPEPRAGDVDDAGPVLPAGTFVPVVDLLRREGRPLPEPAPAPDTTAARPPVIRVPRRRAATALRSALGAGGLVVAGSVLGAALFALAGLDVPLLPSGPGGGQGVDGLVDGAIGSDDGPAVRSPVTGQRVVALRGLVRQAYARSTPTHSRGTGWGVSGMAWSARSGASGASDGGTGSAGPALAAAGPGSSANAGNSGASAPVTSVGATATSAVTAAPRAVLDSAAKATAPVAAAGKAATGAVGGTARSVGKAAAGGGAAVERTTKDVTKASGNARKVADDAVRDTGSAVGKTSKQVTDTAKDVTEKTSKEVTDTAKDVGGKAGGTVGGLLGR